jgi:hypothetical protein
MTTSPLLLVVLLAALASTAAAADAGTTLRGKTVRNHHQHHKIKPADVAATEAVMAQAAPATKPGTESTINLKHTMTTGENLGQNSPFAGIECECFATARTHLMRAPPTTVDSAPSPTHVFTLLVPLSPQHARSTSFPHSLPVRSDM